MQRNDRPSLKGCLDFLTNEDPPLDTDLRIDYIILRRLNNGKDWVDVEFVDGDVKDEKEWFEGPFHQQTTIRELFGKRRKYDRRVKRKVYGIKKRRDVVDSDDLTGEECVCG